MKREKFMINILWAKFDNRDHLSSSPLQDNAMEIVIFELW